MAGSLFSFRLPPSEVTFDIIADQAFGLETGCVAGDGSGPGYELAKAVAKTLEIQNWLFNRFLTGARFSKSGQALLPTTEKRE